MKHRCMHHVFARQHHLVLGHKTCVMGIINCSPDSFSGDGQETSRQAIRQAINDVKHGAGIIDIGGESTRPGAKAISEAQEIQRVIPVITALAKKVNVPISIDTYKVNVAAKALEAGASIVNIVHGVRINVAMIKLIKRYEAAVVLMHTRGNSRTMPHKTGYINLISDIQDELIPAVKKCLDLGLKKDKIIIDPGIGFAKTAQQNLTIIKSLRSFDRFDCPILIGPSRKSFMQHVLGVGAQDRDWGTAACVSAAIMQGAHIVRVHHVKAMVQVCKMMDAIIEDKA